MYGIVLSRFGWCPYLLLGIVRQTTKTNMQDLHLLLLLNPWLIVEMWPAEVFSIGINFVDVLQNWLNWFHFVFLEGGLLVILMNCIIFLSPFLDVTRVSMSTV